MGNCALTTLKRRAMMRGRAFYPGGDAVWKEDGERGLALPLPDKPLMFVGQNFDDEDDPVQYQRTPFS
jgi:hypothetical protein